MNYWFYNDDIILSAPKEYLGFVYEITNCDNKRKYIGQKHFWKHKKLYKSKPMKESNWHKYYGSNDELKQDVNDYGYGYFKRKILHMCVSESHMNWLELVEQMKVQAVINPMYYNKFVGGKISYNQLKGLVEKGLITCETLDT